jgi:hypothetical protein
MCLPLGWLGTKLERTRRQRRAAAVINAGGSAWYLGPESTSRQSWSSTNLPYDSQRPDGNVLERLVEEATAGDVVAVTFRRGQLGEQFVSRGGRLAPSAGNQPFHFDGQEVGGDSTSRWRLYGEANHYGTRRTTRTIEFKWQDLQAFEALQVLSMGDKPVGPDDLMQIAKLKQLRCLLISNGKEVTDECLVALTRLTKLRVLVINNSQITDDGLAHLSGLTNLEVLELDGSAVSGRGLAHLARLQNLKLISLRETPLEDAGLAHLAALTGLQRLYFYRTRVTDAGLRHLSRLHELQVLHLGKTSVTFDAANAFEKSLGRNAIIR